jgi:hypothetical protein
MAATLPSNVPDTPEMAAARHAYADAIMRNDPDRARAMRQQFNQARRAAMERRRIRARKYHPKAR